MPRIPEEEIEALEVRKAAIHECGHAWIGSWYGYWTHPWVERNPDYSMDPVGQRSWIGHCRHEWMNTDLHKRRFCMAGMVANLLHEDPQIDDASLFDLLVDSIWFHELSESDLSCLIHSNGEPRVFFYDVKAVAAHLRKVWPNLLTEAESLIAAALNIDHSQTQQH